MAHIKSITSTTLGNCCCDCCGKHITNVVSVTYADGTKMNYGTTCFDKLCKSGKLSKYGLKLMRDAVKGITAYTDLLEKYKTGELNENTDQSYISCQPREDGGYYTHSYWSGKPFNEYRDWMINEWIPMRLSKEQETIDKFARIDF